MSDQDATRTISPEAIGDDAKLPRWHKPELVEADTSVATENGFNAGTDLAGPGYHS